MEDKSKAPGLVYRIIRAMLMGLVIFYAGTCLLVFCFQRSLEYHPPVRSGDEVDQQARAAGMERWTNAGGEFIGLRRLATNPPAEGVVFMLYGNASSAVRCADYADAIQPSAALDFYVLEYPGYEDRPGPPTRKAILQAAQEAFQRLDARKPIYLIGESLGTGVAAWLAGQFPDKIAGIMLLSPYTRLDEVAQSQYPWLPARWLLLDDFRPEDYLRNYHGRVGIMIDGQDQVVPPQLGHRLYDGYTGPKRLWEYPECHHVELGESPETFWRAVIRFWQTGENQK